MTETKRLKFEDLQPHVEMLCDAIENRGASSSGIPNPKVFPYADKYREILANVRAKKYNHGQLFLDLTCLNLEIKRLAENNQYHRIEKIADALDVFILKEYDKYKLLPDRS